MGPVFERRERLPDLLREFAPSGLRRRQFAQQFSQVAMIYVTRPWLIVGLCASIFLTYSLLAIFLFRPLSVNHRAQQAMLSGICILILWLVAAFQAKYQFAHPRAAVVPGFVRAHLAVVVALLVLSLIIHPLIVAACLRVNGIGAMALAAAAVAPLVWGILSDPKWFFLTGGVALSAAMNSSVSEWWLQSHNLGVHLIIVCFAWVAIAAWLGRLSQLREEQDEYRWKFGWPAAGRFGAETPEHRRLVAAQVIRSRSTMWICDRWHARLGGFHRNKFFRIARLLRYGFGPAPIEFTAPFGIAAYFAVSYGMSVLSPSRGGPGDTGPASTFWVQLVILMGVAGAMGGKWLAQRRPRMATDLLRPLTRAQLVDGLMAAGARDALFCWLLANTGMIIALWGFQTPHFSLAGIATLLLLSVAAASLMFGESFRLGISDSHIGRLARLLPANFVTIGLLVNWFHFRDDIGDGPFVLGGFAMLVVGVWLTARARKAWLNLELG